MNLIPLELKGAFEIRFDPSVDERGYFMRTYDRKVFFNHGLQTEWVQESTSLNKSKNTIRGLHFQNPPFAESKIVRVVQGAILDVFVDLRKDSDSYGEWLTVELAADNNKAVYIPRGFAHGFRTLLDNTMIEYKIDVEYHADLAGGIRWNDGTLKVKWDTENPIISDRDSELQTFSNFDSPF